MLLQKSHLIKFCNFPDLLFIMRTFLFSPSTFIRKLLKIKIYDSMRFQKILELETEIGHSGENDGHPWQRAEEMEGRRGARYDDP